MKTRLISLLTAIFVTAVGFHGAPAQAGPTVSLAFNGFFAASNVVPLTFDGVNELSNLGLSMEVIDAMDTHADGGYSAIFGLHYDITVNDPAPATPRGWLLGLNLAIDGTLLSIGGEIPFDETTLGLPSSLSGIPVGTFSVNDLALIGGLIFDAILDPCAGPPAVADPISGVGACLYIEGPGGPLSGDLYVGLTSGLGGLPLPEMLGPVPQQGGLPFLAIGEFEGDITLVSEPGTLAVLGLGLVAAGFVRRRYVH